MSLLRIPVSDASLEARYHTNPIAQRPPLAILIPPHPQHEGTMDHLVMHGLFRVFASLGFNVLRFNFRPVQQNHTVGNEDVDMADAAACLDWLQSKNNTPSQCWVAGYSYGAYIALQLLMRRPECYSFISLCPPVNLYDFNFLAPCPTPGLVIYGEMDEVVPKESAIRFLHQIHSQRQRPKVESHIIPGADHAFTKDLKTIERLVYAYLSKEMTIEDLQESRSMLTA